MTHITNSFHLVLTILRYIGLYSDDDHKPSKLFKLWTYLLYFSPVLLTFLAFVNILTGENSDIMQVTQMVVFVANSAAACLKALQFFLHEKKIKKCILYFGERRFAPRNNEEQIIMDDCLHVCRRNVNMFAIMLVFIEVWWNVMPLFQKEYTLPVKIWLPYELTSNFTIFCSTYIFMIIGITYLGLTALLEPLLGGLAYHATTQIKILKHNFINFADDINGIEKSLQRCILLHNDILDFVVMFQKCFSWCIFYQIAGTLIALCFCCIGVTIISSASVDAVVFVTCYFVISAQLFFYCHYGTLLYEESKGIIDAIYMSPWHQCNTKVRKILLIVMECSKKPSKITAGEIVDLTYQSFTSTLKSSYSLIAVLNNYF